MKKDEPDTAGRSASLLLQTCPLPSVTTRVVSLDTLDLFVQKYESKHRNTTYRAVESGTRAKRS